MSRLSYAALKLAFVKTGRVGTQTQCDSNAFKSMYCLSTRVNGCKLMRGRDSQCFPCTDAVNTMRRIIPL